MPRAEPKASRRAVDPGFLTLLKFLQESRALDVSRYKRSTVQRRVQQRLDEVGMETYEEYIDYLQVHPEEYKQLFDALLIGVTSFFRDVEPWQLLTDQVIPTLLRGKTASEPLRAWVAGCATGQEPYTLAMLVAELVGRANVSERLKIYATDLDDSALDHARRAIYRRSDVESVPPELLDRYFKAVPDGFQIDPDLRRPVIFGRHDLLNDAPISRLDLIVCRNVLMYFTADAQAELLRRFHFSLVEGGYLLLGHVEMLADRDLFHPVDPKLRLFLRRAQTDSRRRPFPEPPARSLTTELRPEGEAESAAGLAFELSDRPKLVVDPAGTVTMVNAMARRLFALTPEAVGHSFDGLALAYEPPELRRSVSSALNDQRAIALRDVGRTPDLTTRVVDIDLVPLMAEGTFIGVLISLTDVSRFHQLQREREAAYDEVQTTNEELETTNEELHTTVEELETTMEELQSTNEELERMNEELASTNAELSSINVDLQSRTDEVEQASALLRGVLEAMRQPLLVVDTSMRVRMWNRAASELWGIDDTDAGKRLARVYLPLPVEQLSEPLRAAFEGAESGPIDVAVAEPSSDGPDKVRVWCRPMRGSLDEVEGALIVVDSE